MTESQSRELESCSGVAPLSPFLWQVPSCGVIVPVGCDVGPVADVCVQAKELSLRFDQLVSELEGPYYHPVSDVFRNHPLHTHALSKHQFDVLRYGMVVDRSARLVLVAVPRQCGDSGALAAVGYEALHGSPLSEGSYEQQHPLHEEHVFVVYQLSADDSSNAAAAAPTAKAKVRAKALFRLVFRNEAYLNNPKSEQSKHFPVYILRAVFISISEFYHVHQEVAQHRRFHANPVHPDSGNLTPDARVAQMLQHPAVVAIANAWIQVVEGILSSRYQLESVPLEASSGSSDLSSPRRADRLATSVARSTLMDDQRFPLLTTRTVRTSYCHAFERMVRRIDITRKSRDLIAAWRSGDLDVGYFAVEAVGAEPACHRAPCVRVLFRETRSGHNFIEDGELVAFLPQEADCERLQVYSNVAAERLRLWVLRSLITAEVQGIHVLLLEFDPAFMIAQCVGLLRGSESNRDREVLFHLCKIVVETVEDYLQHTGNVWKVTIAVAGAPSDVGGVDVERLCVDILECVQLAKHRLELEKVTASADSAGLPAGASQTEATTGRERDTNAVFTAEQMVAQRAPLSENVIFAATTHRVLLTDDKLYPLFRYCDTNDDGFVSVRDLVLLMLCKENKIDRAHLSRNGYETPLSDAEALRLQASRLVAHPLCPLDGCGLPFDETTMHAFVHSFCRHRSADGEEKLNYLEFSMMMLALARR